MASGHGHWLNIDGGILHSRMCSARVTEALASEESIQAHAVAWRALLYLQCRDLRCAESMLRRLPMATIEAMEPRLLSSRDLAKQLTLHRTVSGYRPYIGYGAHEGEKLFVRNGTFENERRPPIFRTYALGCDSAGTPSFEALRLDKMGAAQA